MVRQLISLQEKRPIMAFKDAFVRLRKQRGWTQQHLSERIGISVGQVKKYEKGDSSPTLPILERICVAFGISADELVFAGGHGVASKKLEPDLLSRFEQVADLPDREKDAVLVLLDSVIAKHRLRQVIST